MASWYCSSVKYNAVATWAALHVYIAGDIVRQTAPTDANARCFRTALGGTSGASEPTWNTGQGSTTTDSTVTWTEVTGQSSYGWSAPFLRERQMYLWMAAGDTQYVGSDHAYSLSSAIDLNFNDSPTKEGWLISVNTAGSVPPVAGDVLSGAKETTTGNANISVDGNGYVYGHEYVSGSGQSGTADIRVNWGNNGSAWYDACKFTIATSGASSRIKIATTASNNPNDILLTSPTFKFGATGQAIAPEAVRLRIVGGSVDSGGSIPTNLFKPSTFTGSLVLIEGADLSALGSNTIVGASNNSDNYQFIGCKLGTSYVLFAGTSGSAYGGPEVTAVNCSSGALNYINEKHNYLGDLTTEATIVRTGGASDGTTPVSWKVVTGAKATLGHPFETIIRAIWNNTVGSSVTLTVEVENDGTTAKNSDIYLDVDYLSSASFPTLSRSSSRPATILTAGANLTTSSQAWTTTGQGSPVKQLIAVSFTPQMKGYVYYTVKVPKASFTVYFDPLASLS